MIQPPIATALGDPAKQAIPPLVMRIPEFAARYDVCKGVVYKWLAQGLPHLRPSRRLTRIPVKEADEWLYKHDYRQRERVWTK